MPNLARLTTRISARRLGPDPLSVAAQDESVGECSRLGFRARSELGDRLSQRTDLLAQYTDLSFEILTPGRPSARPRRAVATCLRSQLPFKQHHPRQAAFHPLFDLGLGWR
jgi:hypothetical protein